ncbi:MAG: GNAT family N-acetyltransferase [Fimbriimonadaceae bacterium]
MSLVVREASFPADADAMQSVWSWVYSLRAPTEPLDPPAGGEKWYIGLEDGTPAVACKVHGYAVARGEADLSCGGVASVATLSEHRQKGHGTRFMDEVLALMRAHGHVISSLYAFRDPFYARSGYGTCGWRWKIVCPAHRMPKTKCDLPVRQVMPAEVECLSGALTKFVRGFSGSVVRTPEQWQNRLGTKPPLIYAVGDPIEAYAWVRITEFWGNVDVGELVWTTPRGYDAILAVVRGIGHNQKTFTFMEPPDSRFLAAHFDQGVEMSLYRQTMHRVLDVPKALEALKPTTSGEFTIGVKDAQVSDNDGPWKVTFEPGRVQVEKTNKAGINLHIGAFSQALMGSPSLGELAKKGLVQGDTAEAEKLLTPMPVCCMEFF